MKQPNFPHFYMRLNEMQIKFKIFLALLLKMGGIAAIHQKFPRFWWKKVEPKGVAWPAVCIREYRRYMPPGWQSYTYTDNSKSLLELISSLSSASPFSSCFSIVRHIFPEFLCFYFWVEKCEHFNCFDWNLLEEISQILALKFRKFPSIALLSNTTALLSL